MEPMLQIRHQDVGAPWFADLSPYAYGLVTPIGWSEDGPPAGGVDALFRWMNDAEGPAYADDEVNVGWLHPGHPTGDAGEDFVRGLRRACATQRHLLMRGPNLCLLCGLRSHPAAMRCSWAPDAWQRSGATLARDGRDVSTMEPPVRFCRSRCGAAERQRSWGLRRRRQR